MKKTEIQIAESSSYNHEYLPVTGWDVFTKASTLFLLGESSPAIKENRAHGVQSLSGTGALRLGGEFLARKLKRSVVYYSNPTWGKFLVLSMPSIIVYYITHTINVSLNLQKTTTKFSQKPVSPI